MKTVELNNQQLSFLILALQNFEKTLLDSDGETIDAASDDLIMAQGLIKRLQEIRFRPEQRM